MDILQMYKDDGSCSLKCNEKVLPGEATYRENLTSLFEERIKTYKSQLRYADATYHAERLYTLKADMASLMVLAECLLLDQNYKCLIHKLERCPFFATSMRCRYMVAMAYYRIGKFENALATLDDGTRPSGDTFLQMVSGEDHQWQSGILLLRGKIYENSKNTLYAIAMYKETLRQDPCCHEAYHRLTRLRLLTEVEEKEFFTSINSKVEFPTLVMKALRKHRPLKEDDGRLYDFVTRHVTDPTETSFRDALKAYDQMDFNRALKIVNESRSRQPYHEGCIRIMLGCLFELKKTSELFSFARELFNADKKWPLSLYAVACFYMSTDKNEHARKFLRKAISLDPAAGDIWIALGHAFAADSEHDQAIAAYFAASKFIRGSHHPFMYVGLEYSKTNNSRLAEKFYLDAKQIKPNDPTLLQELAVAQYSLGKFIEAKHSFDAALKMGENIPAYCSCWQHWEPIYNNLGHVYRRLGLYDEALVCFNKALSIRPQIASTIMSRIATLTLSKRYDEAFEAIHEGIFWKEKLVSANLFNKLLSIIIENSDIPSAPDADVIPTRSVSSVNPTVVMSRQERKAREALSDIAGAEVHDREDWLHQHATPSQQADQPNE